MSSALSWFIVFLGGAAAGAMNALAGGGTFFSFPALLAAGLAPITANATNSVALWPASLASVLAYRRELLSHQQQLPAMVVRAALGGAIGAGLLLITTQQTFAQLIPWLLLAATLIFALAPRIRPRLKRPNASRPTPGAQLFQLLVAIYGGFFGAGMGIVMIAAIALQGVEEMHEIQALKNLLSAVIYTVAALTFVVSGAVSWPHLVVTALAASLGGYAATYLARQLPVSWLRRFVLFVGTALTCYYFALVYFH
jgi:hypothetical protein